MFPNLYELITTFIYNMEVVTCHKYSICFEVLRGFTKEAGAAQSNGVEDVACYKVG
jgi:hypothetical protein